MVSAMATERYIALLDDETLVDLGQHRSMTAAMDVEPVHTHWVFSEAGLRDLRDRINKLLGDDQEKQPCSS